ncbi:hypothetical protein EsH8_IX_000967 [Colletotrichum jinshuiense]
MSRYLLPILAATAVLAKTDTNGCTSFTSTVTVNPSPGYGNTYETVIWYVPDTLEICQGVDCGGGRAPPRKVPGCPAYSGTDTITASFLPTDPAKKPAPAATAQATTPVEEDDDDSTTVTVTPTRTSTVIKVVTTSTSLHSTAKNATLSEGGETTGVASKSGGASASTTAASAAGGTQSGTGASAASGTSTPAGAGPTARAGMMAMLGVAAAAVALA